MAISINVVRNVVLNLLNKNNRYIGVDTFNLYCQLAQMSIFEGLFFEYNANLNKNNRRLTGTEYADLEKNIQEVIDTFSVYSTDANFVYDSGTNLWGFTGTDLYRTEGLSFVNTVSDKKTDVEKVNKTEFNMLVNNNISAPSVLFPIYIKIGTKYQIAPIPTAPYTAQLFYLRTPKDPKFTYIMIDDNPVYNPSAGDLQDIELPAPMFEKIVIKILGYCGLDIREEEVMQAANTSEIQTFQKQQ